MNKLELFKYTIFIVVKTILIYLGIGVFLPEEIVFTIFHGLIPLIIVIGLLIFIYFNRK